MVVTMITVIHPQLYVDLVDLFQNFQCIYVVRNLINRCVKIIHFLSLVMTMVLLIKIY